MQACTDNQTNLPLALMALIARNNKLYQPPTYATPKNQYCQLTSSTKSPSDYYFNHLIESTSSFEDQSKPDIVASLSLKLLAPDGKTFPCCGGNFQMA
jgi:hypothetical protein